MLRLFLENSLVPGRLTLQELSSQDAATTVGGQEVPVDVAPGASHYRLKRTHRLAAAPAGTHAALPAIVHLGGTWSLWLGTGF